jgi:hypothetical protein
MKKILDKTNLKRVAWFFLAVSLIVVIAFNAKKDCCFLKERIGYMQLCALQEQIGFSRACLTDIRARFDEKTCEDFENFHATILYYSFWEIMNMHDFLRVGIFQTLTDALKENMLWALNLVEKRNHGYVPEDFHVMAKKIEKEIQLAKYDDEKTTHLEEIRRSVYHNGDPGGNIAIRNTKRN